MNLKNSLIFQTAVQICIMFLVGGTGFTQTGTPFIHNYSRSEYQAGRQNWMIGQAPDGRIYFANNDGLLEFDGVNWQVYSLPNGTVVRSILPTEDGRIFIGGYNEFGVFVRDKRGNLTYRSFKPILPDDERNFDELWRIHLTPDGVIFQAYDRLYIYKDGKIEKVPAPGKFHFSWYVNGQLIVVDLENGLMRYAMGKFFPMPGTQQITGKEIGAILPYKDNLLIATASEGVYVYDGNELKEWDNPAAGFIKQGRIYSAVELDNSRYAFGTVLNGLVICSNDGSSIEQISRKDGLQNNTILSIYVDLSGNLWLGTDNGIDYVEINSPLRKLSYPEGLSAGYAALVYKDTLYLGTNQGVYRKAMNEAPGLPENKEFRFIPKTEGQVWTIDTLGGQLIFGIHTGVWKLAGDKAVQISNIPGGWTFRAIPDKRNEWIGGTYSGLTRITLLKNGRFEVIPITGFQESSRMIELENDGSVWMSHGFKGVYHIFLNQSYDTVKRVDFYNEANGFSTSTGINVCRVAGQILFTTRTGLYRYEPVSNTFIKSEWIPPLTDREKLSLVREDTEGNIWFVAAGVPGVLRLLEDGTYREVAIPFRQLYGKLIGGFEFIYPASQDNIIFGANDGFILYNPNIQKNYRLPFQAFIHSVTLLDPDSVIFGGHFSDSVQTPDLPWKYNSIRFSFAANSYENPENILYSTWLEGYEDEWTPWDNHNTREFTNLTEGQYTFQVKARTIFDSESEPVSYQFSIAPPFHRTIWAYIVYILFGLFLVLLILYFIRKKIERSKQREAEQQKEKFKEREERLKREALEAEKEIIRLRNEKLRKEMIMKDKELANSTMETIQKNKLLNKIKTELRKIQGKARNQEVKEAISSLIRKINREVDTEKQWEVFETHFESVHEAFLTRIKEAYPDLSPRELKLCAYLRMNISSKEIAALMNISTRGVEISRDRLRKKLGLSRDQNLTEFILTF